MAESKYSPRKDKQLSKYQRQMKFFLPWFGCTFVSIFFVGEGGLYALPFQMLVIILGCVICKDSFQRLCRSLESRRWPKTTFSVVDASVRNWPSDRGNWLVTMRVKYQLDGGAFYQVCHDLNNRRFISEAEAKAYVEAVKKGEYGDYIWYNPFNYQEAFLSRGVSFGAIFGLIIATAMVFIPPLIAFGIIELQ